MRPTRSLLSSPVLPALQTVGFAAQRFSHFINRQPDPHQHDVVEIFLVLSGTGTHVLADGRTSLRPGDFAVLHFGQEHSIVTGLEPMDIVNIYINPARYRLPALTAPLSAVLPRILPLSPGLAHLRNRVTQMRLPSQGVVSTLLIRLAEEAAAAEPGHLEAMQCYLHLFLIEWARAAALEQPSLLQGSRAASPSIERVRRYLDAHSAQPHRLEDLAGLARISREHLCRRFRQETGRTLIEYLHQRRIEQAMIHLDTTEEKIIAIACQVGFRDPSQFNRAFRRVVGMAPKSYRERGRPQP